LIVRTMNRPPHAHGIAVLRCTTRLGAYRGDYLRAALRPASSASVFGISVPLRGTWCVRASHKPSRRKERDSHCVAKMCHGLLAKAEMYVSQRSKLRVSHFLFWMHIEAGQAPIPFVW